MKNILKLTFLVAILFFAEKGLAQEVEKDKMKPKAAKNSYEIVFDNIETASPFAISDDLLIWIEENRAETTDKIVRKDSQFQVLIFSKEKTLKMNNSNSKK